MEGPVRPLWFKHELSKWSHSFLTAPFSKLSGKTQPSVGFPKRGIFKKWFKFLQYKPALSRWSSGFLRQGLSHNTCYTAKNVATVILVLPRILQNHIPRKEQRKREAPCLCRPVTACGFMGWDRDELQEGRRPAGELIWLNFKEGIAGPETQSASDFNVHQIHPSHAHLGSSAIPSKQRLTADIASYLCWATAQKLSCVPEDIYTSCQGLWSLVLDFKLTSFLSR